MKEVIAMTMTMNIAYTEQQSETWLLERIYHAKLRDGRELSVPDLTRAMTQITGFSVPLSTWQEISAEQAQVAYQQGIPLLLSNEYVWEHHQETNEPWGPNSNMRILINEYIRVQPRATAGTEYAVCYLDSKRDTYSNAAWSAEFPSNTAMFLDGNAHAAITFFSPCVQFPSTVHYTVKTSDGHMHEYADRAGAMQGFQTLVPQEGGMLHPTFPQFCYYNEVTCPSGIYRLEFFGPRMDEQEYDSASKRS